MNLDIHDIVYLFVPKYGYNSNVQTITRGVVQKIFKECARYATQQEEWEYEIKVFPAPPPYADFYCENTIIHKKESDIGKTLFLKFDEAEKILFERVE